MHDYANSEGSIDLYILGSYNMDIVSLSSRLPKAGQTVHALSTHFYAGGKGANQATAAAKVSNKVHFCTKIGTDSFAQSAEQTLQSINLASLTLLKNDTLPTGNAVILVDNETGENCISIDLGANKTITESEFEAQKPFIDNCKVFLTQLENNFDITEKAIKYAASKNKRVVLNPAPYISDVKTLLSYVDVLTPNETEAEDITGIKITDIESAEKAAKAIYLMGVNTVIITLGSKGCLSFDGVEFNHTPVFKAKVVDTSGAGDSFNGSLAAMLAQGHGVNHSIRYASAFASLAVEKHGASSVPNSDEVEQRLEQSHS